MAEARTALITGASSGIGRELATQFARDGYQLVLVARHEPALQQVADELRQQFGASSLVLAVDLSDGAAPQTIYERVTAAGLEVETLVNNAGFAVFGDFADSDLAAQTSLLQVNIVALTALTRLFLPAMRARRRGHILNVASAAGFLPGPNWICYAASKAYVVSFSEGLGYELRKSGVTVTTLCPGPTETPFIERGQAGDSALYKGRKVLTAAAVAQAGYRAMQRGKSLIVVNMVNALMVFGIRFMPRRMVLWTVDRFVGRSH